MLQNIQEKFSIHPNTQLGAVSLAVSNLDSQISFYQQILGLYLHTREGNIAILGTSSQQLVHLEEFPDLKRYRGVTGLYHLAIVFPSQGELARVVARLIAARHPISPTDHIMTKAIYLDDPEGNGIELYAESPEDGTWFMEEDRYFARRADGSLSDGREPLDLKALFNHLPDTEPLDTTIPEGTRMGHVHLHVQDIKEALNFYHGLLGFDIMGQVTGYQMAFVSAGGYHHHIGLNTWQGVGAPPPPPDALGLRQLVVNLPDQDSLQTVIRRIDAAGVRYDSRGEGILLQDPSQNSVLLTTP
ncbi:MAG: VOC family protein [Anaerolineales bacterium]